MMTLQALQNKILNITVEIIKGELHHVSKNYLQQCEMCLDVCRHNFQQLQQSQEKWIY